MKPLIIAVSLCLTACAGNPPKFLSAMYNGADPCQFQNIKGANLDEKVANMPDFCGASNSRKYIYATPQQKAYGAKVGYQK